MTKKIHLRRIKGDGFPSPPKLSSCAFFHDIFQKKNQKDSKRMRWTSLGYLSKTNQLQLISFLKSNFSSTCHGVTRLFAKTKVRKD